jgi:parvulin-like peptidyl-prolyl isomerase
MALLINAERVEETQIKEEMERMRPAYRKAFAEMEAQAAEMQLVEWSKENLIERTCLRQEAMKMVVELHPEAVNRLYFELKKQQQLAAGSTVEKPGQAEKSRLKKEAELQLGMEKLLEKINGTVKAPSDAEIEVHYQSHLEEYMLPPTIRAAHIVKHVHNPSEQSAAEEALAGAKQAMDAGESFEEAAGRYSDCPENSGDLGYFSPGQMVQIFDDVVFQMQPGQVSDVFKTEFGYHIAKVYDRKPPAAVPLEQVKDRVRKKIIEEREQAALENYLDELRLQAVIQEIP